MFIVIVDGKVIGQGTIDQVPGVILGAMASGTPKESIVLCQAVPFNLDVRLPRRQADKAKKAGAGK